MRGPRGAADAPRGATEEGMGDDRDKMSPKAQLALHIPAATPAESVTSVNPFLPVL